MKQALMVLAAVLGLLFVTIGGAAAAYAWKTSGESDAKSVEYEQAYDAAYETAYEKAYGKAFDSAHKEAFDASRGENYGAAHDAEYKDAYKANYIAAYARQAMEFQCEGIIEDVGTLDQCKANARAQAAAAYARLGR